MANYTAHTKVIGPVGSVSEVMVCTSIYIASLDTTIIPNTKIKMNGIIKDGSGFLGYVAYTEE